MKSTRVSLLLHIVAASTIVISGCRSVELQAHGEQDPKPAINRCGLLDCCIGSYWEYWITDSPQQILDKWSQHEIGGSVSTQGIFRIEVESNLLYDLVTVGTVGLVAPVNVRCWMQASGEANVLPNDVQHKRPRRQ